MQRTLVSTYTRVYPGDADDVVAGRPRPVQDESTVEVGRVYLIADKAWTRVVPSRAAGRSNGILRIQETLYGHGLS